jgi:2-succinyl-5-enolpyruvyl-6-hydroxy-3-cyclohexene-1-carboxylate synthase
VKLLEEILSRKNLNDAYLQFYRNKGASGVDGVTVEQLYE